MQKFSHIGLKILLEFHYQIIDIRNARIHGPRGLLVWQTSTRTVTVWQLYARSVTVWQTSTRTVIVWQTSARTVTGICMICESCCSIAHAATVRAVCMRIECVWTTLHVKQPRICQHPVDTWESGWKININAIHVFVTLARSESDRVRNQKPAVFLKDQLYTWLWFRAPIVYDRPMALQKHTVITSVTLIHALATWRKAKSLA